MHIQVYSWNQHVGEASDIAVNHLSSDLRLLANTSCLSLGNILSGGALTVSGNAFCRLSLDWVSIDAICTNFLRLFFFFLKVFLLHILHAIFCGKYIVFPLNSNIRERSPKYYLCLANIWVFICVGFFAVPEFHRLYLLSHMRFCTSFSELSLSKCN